MKAKTLLELLSLSTNLYVLSKDPAVMEKIHQLNDKGVEKINQIMSEKVFDDNGKELEFVDKLILKANEAKEELEVRIEETVAKFYHKINVAHTDEIKALKINIEQLTKDLALAEARLNRMENKNTDSL